MSEQKDAAIRMYEDKTFRDYFCDLAERWWDEYEYEDIADYQEALQPRVEKFGFTLLRMKKRPFGIVFQGGSERFAITLNARYMYRIRRA